MGKPYFTGIERIPYTGPGGSEPLAYHWYDADRVVLGNFVIAGEQYLDAVRWQPDQRYWASLGINPRLETPIMDSLAAE